MILPSLYQVLLCLALVHNVCTHPYATGDHFVDDDFDWSGLTTNEIPLVPRSERSWLWGWSWGAESIVSVIENEPVVSFPSRPAAFGAEIRDPILGYVIPVSSFTKQCTSDITSSASTSSDSPASPDNLPQNPGCPSLCPHGRHQPTETWIALVQRGECEFVKKVREAQRLGAKAVIVGGDNPDVSGYPDALVNMYSPEDSSDVKIAATYIKYSDYSHLFSLIQASNTSHSGLRTLSIMITAEYSPWEWYSPIITFVIILLLPSLLTFLTLLIHRVRAARAAQRDRAPESVVRNLPWQVWTGNGWEKHEAGDQMDSLTAHRAQDEELDLEHGVTPSQVEGTQGLPASNDANSNPSTSDPNVNLAGVNRPWFEDQLECAICLCDFAKGDKVRVLPCHHIFHLDEVDEWLITRKKLCPVCKSDVTQPWHPSSPPTSNVPQPFIATDEEHQSTHSTTEQEESQATERTPLLGFVNRLSRSS